MRRERERIGRKEGGLNFKIKKIKFSFWSRIERNPEVKEKFVFVQFLEVFFEACLVSCILGGTGGPKNLVSCIRAVTGGGEDIEVVTMVTFDVVGETTDIPLSFSSGVYFMFVYSRPA